MNIKQYILDIMNGKLGLPVHSYPKVTEEYPLWIRLDGKGVTACYIGLECYYQHSLMFDLLRHEMFFKTKALARRAAGIVAMLLKHDGYDVECVRVYNQ